jgi:AcrR family transcriptional regulator
MDPKETREQIIRDAKSGIILDAARKVFAEKGFHDTHLDEIAASAGFSKAALYNYYSDKETIFLSLANRDFDNLLVLMKNNLDANAKFLDVLEKMTRIALSFFGEHFAFMLTSSEFRASEKTKMECFHNKYGDTLFAQFKKKFESISEIFIKMIDDAKKKREIECDLDNRVITNYLVSLVRGVLFEWKMQGKTMDIDQEIKHLVIFLNRGLNIRSNL